MSADAVVAKLLTSRFLKDRGRYLQEGDVDNITFVIFTTICEGK